MAVIFWKLTIYDNNGITLHCCKQEIRGFRGNVYQMFFLWFSFLAMQELQRVVYDNIRLMGILMVTTKILHKNSSKWSQMEKYVTLRVEYHVILFQLYMVDLRSTGFLPDKSTYLLRTVMKSTTSISLLLDKIAFQ